MEPLVETLMTRFPQAVLSVEADTARSEVTVQVAAERLLELARFLHDAPEASFDHLTDICSVDYPEDRQRFEVVYHLHSLSHHRRLRLKARLSEDDPTIESVTPVWKGAEFLEREVYDMMGIRFWGHPDLRRILMWEGYPYFPLRKDFPLAGRPSEMPDVAFTGVAPLEGGPFVTCADGQDTIGREPRARVVQ